MGALSPALRTFGTSSETAHVIGAPEFDPTSDTATWGYGGELGQSKFASGTRPALAR